jgi:hypothetical protein
MLKKILQKSVWYSLAIVFILRPSELLSQPTGGPFFTDTHKQFTVSLDAGKMASTIYGVETRSSRVLLKAVYGLGERLDLFGIAGGVALRLDAPSLGVALDDKYNLAYGAGFRVKLTQLGKSGLSLIGGAQVFRFESNPASADHVAIANSQVTKALEMQYDWREGHIDAGIGKKIGRFMFYTGINFKYVDRKETKIESYSFGESSLPTNIESGRYQSGTITSPVFGIDVKVGGRYKIHAEISGTDKAAYAYYFGISQTGRP